MLQQKMEQIDRYQKYIEKKKQKIKMTEFNLAKGTNLITAITIKFECYKWSTSIKCRDAQTTQTP